MDEKIVIPIASWNKFEHIIHSIGMKKYDEVSSKYSKKELDNILDFLRVIKFIKNKSLTDLGSDYFHAKHIVNEENLAEKILIEAIKKYELTQVICQILWGRPDLYRTNLFKLLVFKNYVNPIELSEQDIGSFLMILNKFKIISYNKRSSEIKILFNPRTSTTFSLTKFLSPETPYSNLRNLWEILRECKKYIYWFDKHFSAKGLEPLHDEADGNKISEIRILTGFTQNINNRMYRDFNRFNSEMATKRINCELRVIIDKQLLNKIHDRWIISDNLCYNVPPINSIYQGQYSELTITNIRPPYEEWWKHGLDIIKDWSTIQQLKI